ncbi:hypothetical protein EJ110_NYTH52873 [Nymphaea thermarum]|nr:hypothetical protein EJ110_NYTH52873 [Nymphaea thermarum]
MTVKHHHFAGRAKPYERRDDRTFRRNQPAHSEATQGSVATPNSPRCPTCSRVHPGKSCYRVTGACLHCGGMGHFIKDCPLKKERELKKPEAGPSGKHGRVSDVVEKRRIVFENAWSTFVDVGDLVWRQLEVVQGPSVLLCVVLGALGSRLPNLGVLGEIEYLSLEFTHAWMSTLPLQRMKWIHTVIGHHGGCLSAVARP